MKAQSILFHFLRLFWPAVLGAILVEGYGWLAGWQGTQRFSDGLFFVAVIQLIIAGGSLMNSPVGTAGAPELRVLTHMSSPGRGQVIADMLAKQSVGMQFFAGAILTGIVAVLVSLF